MVLMKVCSFLVLLVAAAVGGLVAFGRNNDFSRGMIPVLVKESKLTPETMPDLTGKIIIVTGANAGLGKSTAKILAANGATVVMGCRSPSKCSEAKDQILEELKAEKISRKSFKKENLVRMKLDLGSFRSVKDFASDFRKKFKKLDSLILNAGVMHTPFSLTNDGIEMQMGVNHFGHFYLTKLLMPLLEEAQPSTVVVVSSNGHFGSYSEGIRLKLDELNDERKYNSILAYGQSKLANVLFAQELSERVQKEGKQIFVNSLNPGAVFDTDLTRHYGATASWLLKKIIEIFPNTISFTSDDAAMTQIFLAVGPEVFEKKITGKYFVPLGEESNTAAEAKNKPLQKGLWSLSESILKEKGFT